MYACTKLRPLAKGDECDATRAKCVLIYIDAGGGRAMRLGAECARNVREDDFVKCLVALCRSSPLGVARNKALLVLTQTLACFVSWGSNPPRCAVHGHVKVTKRWTFRSAQAAAMHSAALLGRLHRTYVP